jgi:hypothetical protein
MNAYATKRPNDRWQVYTYAPLAISVSEDFFDENIRYSGLDGYSRFLVHWDLREQMTEADIEIILERTKERYPRG